MPDPQQFLRRIDQFQQRHAPIAFIFGVIKKFGDDQGGNLAALLTYYGFLSLFPLLLVTTTVLGFVLHGHPGLQKDLVNSALADFPIIGDQIRNNVTSVQGNGLGLVVGVLGTFYGGLGIANAAQDAMNRVWEVPRRSRPGFFPRILRSLALVGTLGLAVLGITVLGALGVGTGRFETIPVVVVLDIGLFLLAFNVLTARDLRWRDHLWGAVIAGIVWAALQSVGGAIIEHQLRGMSQTYGLFAIVIGLLAWIFLQARVVVYAAEVNVVREERLWPRSLLQSPLTEADRRALEQYADTEERRPDERLEVDLS